MVHQSSFRPISLQFSITCSILFRLVTWQSLLCGSHTLDHVAAYLTIWDHPDLDEDFMGEHETVCRSLMSTGVHVSVSLAPESNAESCNSYLFLTHALCDSGEWVWLSGYCVGVYFVVGSQTVAEDSSFPGMWLCVLNTM